MNQNDLSLCVEEYQQQGFTIFRNVIDRDLLNDANKHLEFLKNKFPNLRPEHYHHPLIRDDAFWVRLMTDSRLLDIAQLFLGPNIANFTAHYICKPPHDGQAVLWHQDGAYWSLRPMQAATLWLAIDHSTPENGCLKMIPGTHQLPLQKLALRDDVPNMLCSEVDHHVDISKAVDLVLEPGDVSVHNPYIIHGSEPNTSNKRRCGLDLGYISTTTEVTNKDLYLYPILARGKAVLGINQYRPWPLFDRQKTIEFPGWEEWNAMVAERNQSTPAAPANDEDVLAVTSRMIRRLKEGTTST